MAGGSVIAGFSARVGHLARCRAAAALDDADCLLWFGVGAVTVERIESGEIEPTAEVAERIARFIACSSGGTISPPPAPGPFTHSGPTGGGGPQVPSALLRIVK